MKILPKELVLDYNRWICGKPHITKCRKDSKDNFLGEGSTKLLNEKGYQCCLGQFVEQAGISKEDMLGLGTPSDFVLRSKGDCSNVVKSFAKVFDNWRWTVNTSLAEDAISINDDIGTTIQEKTKELKELFSTYGYKIKFVNFPKHLKVR